MNSTTVAPEATPARPPAPDPQAAHGHAAPHHALTVPHVKIPMVKGTMGADPMAVVEAVQLLAGLPIPAHLGPNVDTTA